MIKIIWCTSFLFCLIACNKNSKNAGIQLKDSSDSLTLVKMVSEREKAMINKDITAVMLQFSDDATWINSQGYYFQGKNEVQKFHNYLAGNDSLDYYYQASNPRIRMIDANNAMVYYSWKMFWFDRQDVSDTTKKEIGLMSLTAYKLNGNWKWIAVTNQYTPWFHEEIEPVSVD